MSLRRIRRTESRLRRPGASARVQVLRGFRVSRRWLLAAAVAGLIVSGSGGSAAPDAGLGALASPAPHADGPPLSRTGGFGELTCAECHLDLELNAPGGALLVEGVPDSFTPGAAYVVTVVVEGEGMGSAGFQGAARFQDGDRAGSPAGRLIPLDARTIVRTEGGVDYIHHTAEGSELGAGDVASWSFEWVAPPDPAPVVFHVTGNSANGDNSPLGDLIYTAEVAVLPPG